jgi:Family of unknown function (DUF6504)
MSRRYGDVVEVARHDDEPAQFLWRGRLYVVRGVLAHWVETGAWWRSASARALYTGEDAARETAEGRSPGRSADRPPGLAQDPPLGLAEDPPSELPPSVGFDEGEREVWRVEAGAGRSSGTGVFDLCFDWSAGSWTLARALD